jgi:hypothetical protein
MPRLRKEESPYLLSLFGDPLMRNFQEETFGPMHDEDHERLPGNTHSLGSLFDQGLAIAADG